MSIQQLAPDVAAKIAAGEVVERPASVVKELVENALDAGAKQIRIELLNGGLQLIRVSDDGVGIPATELPLAFARHATSKITELQDLERVRSLGFRGEALASIGSVARVRVRSRTRDEELGAEITMDEGHLGQVSPFAEAAGTSIAVLDLFASVPARLKFLKSRSTEAGRATQVVEQYALAYPEVRFSLYSEGRQVFTTPGDGQLFGVLVAVYGLRVAEAMVPLDASPREPVTGGSAFREPARLRARLESSGHRRSGQSSFLLPVHSSLHFPICKPALGTEPLAHLRGRRGLPFSSAGGSTPHSCHQYLH